MVDGSRLLTCRGIFPTEGSNPSGRAKISIKFNIVLNFLILLTILNTLNKTIRSLTYWDKDGEMVELVDTTDLKSVAQ